ncbi:META domain-containing protein [Barnesiella viscericola]|uniref:META domain-containing protein n=1 Tax=Barnesiella viscericola TaxID=397865 RepID=UPI0025A45DE0|nr:META domain-containing protein [Barnesiella viscericola]MDM8270025.1 META domain-containing protein [Barnesiella viscericola]
MKMKCLYVAVAAAVLSLAACRSSKDAVSVNDLDGEWNVVEIQGQAVQAESQPFIGFDAQDGRVYGYTGCNRLMGALTLSKPNKIELGQMASTLMACPDMETERLMLNALASVKSLKCSGKTLVLYGADKEPVMLLQKRFEVVPLSSLNGEWKVVAVNGTALPAMENIPAFSLDMTTHRIGGNSGCNRLSGEIRHDAAVENSISFANVASTRMACPDMDTENQVLSALNQVCAYGMLANGHLALMAEGSTVVLELERSK